MNLLFTRLFRMMWLLFFMLLIFLDRDIFAVKVSLIVFVLLLTVVTILRALESKKEWDEIIKDMDSEDQELFRP